MNLFKLKREQLKLLSSYFADVSKILVGSVMVGFFIPMYATQISADAFLLGSSIASAFLILSIGLAKEKV